MGTGTVYRPCLEDVAIYMYMTTGTVRGSMLMQSILVYVVCGLQVKNIDRGGRLDRCC